VIVCLFMPKNNESVPPPPSGRPRENQI
jgi:hypothetical protein